MTTHTAQHRQPLDSKAEAPPTERDPAASPFAPIPEILEELRNGRLVVLVDDERRENEGDLICAAQCITPELVNFMVRAGGGYLCVSLTGEDCDRLDLAPQSTVNSSMFATPFTVSVDGHPRHDVGTGVSAYDRARTIQLLIDPETRPDDFVRPGHINPLRARDGGVLVRTGQTEGSVDLARLAGLHPSAVIIEIVNESGAMARLPELKQFCAQHKLRMCSVEQVIEYRLARETLIQRIDPQQGTPIDTPYGKFNLIAYQSSIDPLPHLALTVGDVGGLDANGRPKRVEDPVLVRMHRRNLLGDVFEELGNPTGRDLRNAMRMIQDAGRGALVYLRPEGVGENLNDRLLRINRPGDTNINVPDLTAHHGAAGRAQPVEQRDFGIGGQILRELGLSRLRILTNHPKRLAGVHAFGLDIVEQVPIQPAER